MELSNSYQNQNFGAMKKSQFKGMDLFCVNAFKAPIEKFNTNMDLQNWANQKLSADAFTKNLTARSERSTLERNSVFKEWMNFFNNTKDYSKTVALVALSSIFGCLKDKNDDVPPHVNEKVFKQTLEDVENKQSFNLKNEYVKNLKNSYTQGSNTIPDGWIKILSQEHDPENFADNVSKLKLLSANTWCTKSVKAEEYLSKGDFHVLYKNNKPVLGVRMYNDKIMEMQGQANNSSIPPEYLDDLCNYISEQYLDKSYVAPIIYEAQDKAVEIYKMKKRYAKEIAANDGLAIFEKMAIRAEDTPEGKVLDKFKPFEMGISLGELGINENEVFKDIVKINGDANFANSRLTKLPKLEVINGDANFRGSCINDVSALREVNGDVNIMATNLTLEDFKNVKVKGKIIK